jgi:NADP-dependent aldehyde dehydrogenase
MLTDMICRNYKNGLQERQAHSAIKTLAQAPAAGEEKSRGATALLEMSGSALLRDPEQAREVFGPSTLVVRYAGRSELMDLASALEGQLTATLHGNGGDFAAYSDLLAVLERKAGRLIVNGYPTGVEVCHAMVHGGPYPATSDSRNTSVGTQAIYRFVRPVCYQDFPQEALPEELRDKNPLGIWRLVDGAFTRDAVVDEAKEALAKA